MTKETLKQKQLEVKVLLKAERESLLFWVNSGDMSAVIMTAIKIKELTEISNVYYQLSFEV
ncbi:hypothetical protein MEO40_17750 [Dolichospermum sp. ST_sed1]|nr:hypothetical protein [Dolichospermum sp. ST_sed1]